MKDNVHMHAESLLDVCTHPKLSDI